MQGGVRVRGQRGAMASANQGSLADGVDGGFAGGDELERVGDQVFAGGEQEEVARGAWELGEGDGAGAGGSASAERCGCRRSSAPAWRRMKLPRASAGGAAATCAAWHAGDVEELEVADVVPGEDALAAGDLVEEVASCEGSCGRSGWRTAAIRIRRGVAEAAEEAGVREDARSCRRRARPSARASRSSDVSSAAKSGDSIVRSAPCGAASRPWLGRGAAGATCEWLGKRHTWRGRSASDGGEEESGVHWRPPAGGSASVRRGRTCIGLGKVGWKVGRREVFRRSRPR